MSKEISSERLCSNCKVKLEYKGMEDVHTGGRALEILEFFASIFSGLSIAIAIRDLMVKRTTFDFYVCPKCHYTIFIMEDDSSTNANNNQKCNLYREYKKRLENVSQLLSEIRKVSNL